MVSIDLFSIDLLWNMIVAKHLNVLLRPTWYNQTTRYDQKTWFLINDKWEPRKWKSVILQAFLLVWRESYTIQFSEKEIQKSTLMTRQNGNKTKLLLYFYFL